MVFQWLANFLSGQWTGHLYWPDWSLTAPLWSCQRCVVRGIALSSLLSCRLLTNLNSRGSPVAPTWAHLCHRPLSDLCIEVCACANPEAEASTGQFTRMWTAAFCAAGPPEALSWMSRLVTQAAKRERELARAHSQRLKQATLSLPGESVSRGFADRGALEGYPSHYTSLVMYTIWWNDSNRLIAVIILGMAPAKYKWEMVLSNTVCHLTKSMYLEWLWGAFWV